MRFPLPTQCPRPGVARPRPWHFPNPQRTVLGNGLTLLAYPMPTQHVVSLTAVVDAPLTTEPREREGLATICLRTLDEGTLAHPGPSFAEALENHGAVLGGHAGLSASQLHLSVPASALSATLPYLAEALITPAHAPDDVSRHVALRLAEIEQTLAHSSSLADLAFRSTVMDARSRASRPSGGTADTVKDITAAEAACFHRQRYAPERITLVIAGAFSVDLPRQVEAAFGSWHARAAIPPHEQPVPASPAARLLDRPGAVQADVHLGGFGIDRADPRYPAFQVAAYAVGGGFMSRLNRVLREERGFTYGVHLGAAPLRKGGLFSVQGSFRTAAVAEALSEARRIIALDEPLSDTEVAEAVAYLVGVTPLRYATASGLVGQVAATLAAGLTAESIDKRLHAVEAVTAGSATEAYRSLVVDDALSLVVVGDADALEAPLLAAGFPVRVENA